MSVNPEGMVRSIGRRCGFDLVGIAEAQVMHEERERFMAWTDAGRHGQMKWITPEWVHRVTDPDVSLRSARSIISVAVSYWKGLRRTTGPNRGLIARYAWGDDYHQVIGQRLEEFVCALRTELGGEYRTFVDSGPLMERAVAARAGIGWYGRNTNILSPKFGSFILLGEVLTTLDLSPDPPVSGGCGKCRLCAVACPTGALTPDYSIDSRLCISYLTIEHRGPIPRELRHQMGAWVFGCDVCQDVCPPSVLPHLSNPRERKEWTIDLRTHVREARAVRGELSAEELVHTAVLQESPAGHPSEIQGDSGPTGNLHDVDLVWLLSLTHAEYLTAFRGTSIRRAKVWMLRRNAAVALGNVGGPQIVPAVAAAMTRDEHPVVRGHAAWALGHIGRRCRVDTRAILFRAWETEAEADVREEIGEALAAAGE